MLLLHDVNDPNVIAHYDPEHLGPGDDPSGWKVGSPEDFRSYGDHAYTSPTSSLARAKAAGATTDQFQRLTPPPR